MLFLGILFLTRGGVLGGGPTRGMGKKIFVGRLPQEASADDLRQYFGRFGHILDVYVPKVRQQFLFFSQLIYMDGWILNLWVTWIPFDAGSQEIRPQGVWFCDLC